MRRGDPPKAQDCSRRPCMRNSLGVRPTPRRKAEVNADAINQGFVLGNKVMVGTVNASRDDFVRGVDDLVRAEALYPGWLERLLTRKVSIDDYQKAYERSAGDVKTVILFED